MTNTLRGPDIGHLWIDEVGHAMARVQDANGLSLDEQTWTWCHLYMDMDYRQAWLLEVRSEGTYDYLAVFETSERRNLTVEWYGKPRPWNERDPGFYEKVLVWFPCWVLAEIESLNR